MLFESINIFKLNENKGQKINIPPQIIIFEFSFLKADISLYCSSLKVHWMPPKQTLHLLSPKLINI